VLPFTRAQFSANFASYNEAVWPAQWLAYLLGLAVVAMLLRPSRTNSRRVAVGLAAMWAWTGIAYHGVFFATINAAAWPFAALFVVQGVLLLREAVITEPLEFGVAAGRTAWLGWAFILYAAVAYPLLGMWAGDRYPAMPTFGITPCPVTIFTFGVLLMATRPVRLRIWSIPFVWSLVGGSAAVLLRVPQDWLLVASGLVSVAILAFGARSPRTAPAAGPSRSSS